MKRVITLALFLFASVMFAQSYISPAGHTGLLNNPNQAVPVYPTGVFGVVLITPIFTPTGSATPTSTYTRTPTYTLTPTFTATITLTPTITLTYCQPVSNAANYVIFSSAIIPGSGVTLDVPVDSTWMVLRVFMTGYSDSVSVFALRDTNLNESSVNIFNPDGTFFTGQNNLPPSTSQATLYYVEIDGAQEIELACPNTNSDTVDFSGNFFSGNFIHNLPVTPTTNTPTNTATFTCTCVASSTMTPCYNQLSPTPTPISYIGHIPTPLPTTTTTPTYYSVVYSLTAPATFTDFSLINYDTTAVTGFAGWVEGGVTAVYSFSIQPSGGNYELLGAPRVFGSTTKFIVEPACVNAIFDFGKASP